MVERFPEEIPETLLDMRYCPDSRLQFTHLYSHCIPDSSKSGYRPTKDKLFIDYYE